jgi:shikimate dehydrogenase
MIRLDHVGILVRNISEALPLYRELLGLTADPPVELPEQQVRVAFLHAGDGQLDLLEPMTPDCSLAKVLAKRGEGLLHICFEVDDIEASLRHLEAAGVSLVDQHAWTSPHGLVAFLHPKSFRGVSIELRQQVIRGSEQKRGTLQEEKAQPTMLALSGKTKVCTSLGYPIAQSLSPAMQTAAFRARGLDWIYIAWGVRPEFLAVTVKALRANENFAGGNVTAPHKETIVPLLDGLTREAEPLRAVNVILRDGDRLIGHSTDGAGYVAALREAGYNCRGKRVLILGAGGAARAVGVALADAGVAEIWILNRTVTRAESVARLLADAGFSHVRVGPLAEAASALRQIDLVVNATSVGLQKEAPPLFDYGLLRPPALVSDLVFFPRETLFLRQAREQGCRTMNGLGMLLHQAVLSFERWTGRDAPVALMRHALLEALEARERNA